MGHGHRVTNQEQQLPGRVSRISSIGEIGRRLKVRAQRKSSETNDRRTVETKPRWRKRCGNQRHPEPTRPEDIQSCFGRAFPYLIIQCNTAMYNYRASVAMLEELFIINPVDKNCVGHDKDTERIGEVSHALKTPGFLCLRRIPAQSQGSLTQVGGFLTNLWSFVLFSPSGVQSQRLGNFLEKGGGRAEP